MISEEQRSRLEEIACASREQAYAPYSKFRVGAAVLGESGTIYSGANVENASFGLTECAERIAIFKAVTAGERRILAVAVCTEGAVSPCGSCRQVIREFGTDVPVFLLSEDGERLETSLSELLPNSFGPEKLEVEE